MDRFSPVAAAHIRVLVLPVGRIERQNFLDFVRRLQDEAAIIRHKNTKGTSGDGDFLLSPGKSEKGCLLLHYTTSSTSEATLQLSPYEIFREPLLVIGVVGGLGEDEEEAGKELKAATDYLRERHPRVVHRHLLVLKEGEQNTVGNSANTTLVEQSHEIGHPSLVNAMQALAVRFLRELSTYAQAMQASPSIPTPGQTSRNLQRASWMREDTKPGSGYGTPRTVGSPPPPGEDGSSRPPSRSLASPANSFDHIPNTNAAVNALSRSDSNRGHNGRASSQDRIPIQGFGTNTSADKTKRRGRARVGIVVGSVYMMAGLWSEALQMLVEHTSQVRTLQDQLWYAKGLENIVVCQLLLAWTKMEFSVPAVCQQAFEKSSSKQASQRFSTDSLAASAPTGASIEISVRRISAMLPELVRQIVVLYRSIEGPLELPSLIVYEATVRGSKLLAILHNSSGILDDVALGRVIEGGNAGPFDSTEVATASFKSSSLQGSRLLAKSAIAEVLVTGLPSSEDAIAVPDQLAILGGVASVYSILHMDRKKAMTIRELVVRLTAALNQARKLGAAEMGIHPAASLSAEHGTDSLTASIQESGGMLSMIADVANIYGVNLIGGEAKAEDGSAEHFRHTRPRAFGGDALKFSTLRELLALCEASPDPYGILRLIATFFASAGPRAAVDHEPQDGGVAIAQGEQAHLASTISRTIGVSKQLGLTDTQAEYWDPYLVRALTFAPRPTAVELIDWAKLKGMRPSSSAGNPLLYDPNARRQATAEQSAVLVQGEAIDCLLTLQNPYDVALEIESIKFVTEGVELEAVFKGMQLGPARLQQVPVSVTPASTGQIAIKGCRIKLASFKEETFPIVRKPWSEPRSLVVKNLGQEARSGDSDPKQKPADPEHATVSAEVIPPLPTLVLRGTSLVESSVMLLEGERHSFEATVENVSDVEASILDVVGSMEGLTVPKDSVTKVPPRQSVKLPLQIVGRAGMNHLRADVFHTGPDDDIGYARMLPVPISATVNAALQAHHLEVSEADKEGIICASFDIGNAWPKSVPFVCSVLSSGEWEPQSESVLAPGEVQRVYLNIKRWVQDVKSEPNAEDVRKAMLERFRVTWDVDARKGEVPLRNLTLQPEAIEIIRGPTIAVNLSLQDTAASTYKTGSFLTVRATVRNRSTRSAPLLIELQPLLADLASQNQADRRNAVAGTLSRFVTALKVGESREVNFALCPLLTGTLALKITARNALSLRQSDDSATLGESKVKVVRVE